MAEKTFQQKAQSWINPKQKTKQEEMDVVGNVDQGQATIPKPFLSLGTRGNYIGKLWRNRRRKRARNVGGNQVDGSPKPTRAIASQVQGSWERVQGLARQTVHASRGGRGNRHRRRSGCCYWCFNGHPHQRCFLFFSDSSSGFPQSSGNGFSQASPGRFSFFLLALLSFLICNHDILKNCNFHISKRNMH